MDAIAIVDRDGRVAVSGVLEPVPWWSFTKTVLAIASLRLVEMGLLGLDQNVTGEPFTLAHLLRHEAGLPDYGGLAQYHEDVEARRPPWTVERLLEISNTKSLRYQPGKGWAYSNIGYLKVRNEIEQATGASLGEALDQLVFAPAGLTTPRVATSPEHLAHIQMGDCKGYHPGWVYHGLITGTVADAARLLKAFMDGVLLQPTSFTKMLERRALPEHRSQTFKDPAYGLGVMLNADNPLNHPIGHRGTGPGSSMAAYAFDQRACAIWHPSAQNSDLVVEEVFQHLRRT